MAQVGVAQKQTKDVKQILLSYLACRQIWLNYSYFGYVTKLPKTYWGPPLSRKTKKGIFFFKKPI
jgi:hypothetical protein